MIPRTNQAAYPQSWQNELKNLVTCPKALFDALELPLDALPKALIGHSTFQTRVTPSFLARMEKGNLDDPLLKQVLPWSDEALSAEGFSDDPLAEQQHNPVKGLIHKYRSRVLFIATGQCAINCRYCFRRHFDYQANSPSRQQWLEAIAYVAAHPEINEVIFSGGDPLVMGDSQLNWLLSELERIPHLTRVRLHSRIPIVLPSRMTGALLTRLNQSRLQCILVIHANHPNELDSHVKQSLLAARSCGITLLNQSVLMKGINDSAATLTALSEKLFDAGVLPYYLHLMDKVRGAQHFDVAESEAIGLHEAIKARLPGFLVPRLVREIPGEPNKTWLA